MLKNFDKEYSKIISESLTNESFKSKDEIVQNVTDEIGFKDFSKIKNDQIFIIKLKNTDKSILTETLPEIWDNYIEKYDDGNNIKENAESFYYFLQELIEK